MRQIFSILILFLPLSLIGQEFSFSMYFEDAVGNKDTLVLGYDPAARFAGRYLPIENKVKK